MLETRSQIFIQMQMTSEMKVLSDNWRARKWSEIGSNLTRLFPRQLCQPRLGVGNFETIRPQRDNETKRFIILNEEEKNYFHLKYLMVISCRSRALITAILKSKFPSERKLPPKKKIKSIRTKSFTAARSDPEEGSDPVTFTL